MSQSEKYQVQKKQMGGVVQFLPNSQNQNAQYAIDLAQCQNAQLHVQGAHQQTNMKKQSVAKLDILQKLQEFTQSKDEKIIQSYVSEQQQQPNDDINIEQQQSLKIENEQQQQISKQPSKQDQQPGKQQVKQEQQINKQQTKQEEQKVLSPNNAMLNLNDTQISTNQITQQSNSKQVYQKQFIQAYNNLIFDTQIEYSIKFYFQYLVRYSDQDIFFQHFVENQFLGVLITKMRMMKYSTDIVRGTFWGLEYLLKGLGQQNSKNKRSSKSNAVREQQFIYLLIMLNKQGYITQDYLFQQAEDCAYFANFLKLLIRKIMALPSFQNNESETIQDNKYLSIFFNPTQSTFPLLLKLLKLHNYKDPIIQTSVRLCLLQFIRGANSPKTSSLLSNRRLNCYMDNFPFVIMYAMYGCKINMNVKKLLNDTCLKMRPFSKQIQIAQQQLYEQILADLIYLEDFVLTQSPSINHRIQIFCNLYFYYVGRTLFQFLHKTLQNQNQSQQITNKDILINVLMVIQKIMKINSVMKIKLGYREMLRKFIHCNFWDYLVGKKCAMVGMEWKYWGKICVGMGLGVQEYCKAVFFQNFQIQNSVTSSTIKLSQLSNISQKQGISKSFQYTSYPLELEQEHFQGDKSPPKSQKINTSSINRQSLKKTPPQSSFIDIMHSYIPKGWIKWYKNQLKKLSTILGFKISTSNYDQINYYDIANQYSKQSYTSIIDSIQQLTYNQKSTFEDLIKKTKKSFFSRYNSTIKQNNIFSLLIDSPFFEKDRQQCIYYYLGVVIQLIEGKKNKIQEKQQQQVERGGSYRSMPVVTQKNNDCCYWSCVQQIIDFVNVAYRCNSLMLVGVVYWYVKLIDFQLTSNFNNNQQSALISQQNKQLLNLYTNTMAKLTYFVMTEGWGTFLGKFNNIKQTIWNKKTTCENRQFNNDIFRDIQCDILFFIMLRHIFGTKNSQQLQNISQYISETDLITKQIKIPCNLNPKKDHKNHSQNKYMIIDGQYVKFITYDDVLITKQPLSVNKYNIYYEGLNQNKGEHTIEIIDKSLDGDSHTVIFDEKALKDYVVKEIKYRKKIQMEIQLVLRTMKFDLE